ncbi:hypothetical protein Enr8_33140 [Blastopirellula retiformator]|uniref:Uncharacterized protein n=1 Tax=Blastopirellula retiformator TaxID=2527970 RepID=A0A5C5V0C3_9BACT|nr:hypothetical protein Enr8_33140 [Blastopirellula retiformator]
MKMRALFGNSEILERGGPVGVVRQMSVGAGSWSAQRTLRGWGSKKLRCGPVFLLRDQFWDRLASVDDWGRAAVEVFDEDFAAIDAEVVVDRRQEIAGAWVIFHATQSPKIARRINLSSVRPNREKLCAAWRASRKVDRLPAMGENSGFRKLPSSPPPQPGQNSCFAHLF